MSQPDHKEIDRVRPLDRFIVNLDADVKDRWKDVVMSRKSCFARADQYMSAQFGRHTTIEALVRKSLAGAARVGLVMWTDELRGIAVLAGIDFGKLLVLQLVYEACAACTSIVGRTVGGDVVLGRTMDWDADFLRAMTIEVDFRRSGRTVFLATTWAGFVGVFTGMRPGAYAVSVNFRRTAVGTFWSNLTKSAQRAWPVGFLVRAVLDNDQICDYQQAVNALSTSTLIAPCYLTVAGIRGHEGCVLTRGRRAEAGPRVTLNAERLRLTQTNMDQFVDDTTGNIVWSRERRVVVDRLLPSDRPVPSMAAIWNTLQTSPVWNHETVYASVMNPKEGTLETRVVGQNLPMNFAARESPVQPRDMRTALAEFASRLAQAAAKCRRCNREFLLSNNSAGSCIHTGEWHSSVSQCSILKCAIGLAGSQDNVIGGVHWSCCFSNDPSNRTPCSQSLPHRSET